MKIYTKAGDDGTTGLLGQGRVAQGRSPNRGLRHGRRVERGARPRPIASGRLDADLDTLLARVQDELFAVGAALADPDPSGRFHNAVTPALASRLESEIDRLEAELPPLTQFILPGGTADAARLHLARTICRRAERSTVHLRHAAGQDVPGDLIAYLNRLSDLLFVLARVANHRARLARHALDRAVTPKISRRVDLDH